MNNMMKQMQKIKDMAKATRKSLVKKQLKVQLAAE